MANYNKHWVCVCEKEFDNTQAYNGHKGFCEQYRLSIGKEPNSNKLLSRKKLQKGSQIFKQNRLSEHYVETRTCIRCGKSFQVDNLSKQKCCSSKCAHSRDTSGPSQEFIQNKKHDKINKNQEKINLWKISKPKCKYCNKFIDVNIGYPFRQFCDNSCKAKYAITFKTIESHLKSTRHGNAHHGWYKDIPYDSSFELAFIIYNIECLHKKVERFKGYRTYIYNNETHKYFPDFIIDGKIYEVKGQMTSADEAKLNQNPDVILVKNSFIDDCRKYCIHKYGKKFWELFK